MRELKRLREASGLSPDEVAQRLDFSKSKLYRIENGRSRVDADDLEDMLDLYDVRSPERDALVALGRDSRRRGWWTTYKDVFTGSYVGLESEAASVQVMSHLVPGIFQTPDYARAVIATTAPWFDAGETERRVAARTARQHAILGRDNPPENPRRARRGRPAPDGRRCSSDDGAARRARQGRYPARHHRSDTAIHRGRPRGPGRRLRHP
jgi:transcriptional regulator with XRE-family HTH domain